MHTIFRYALACLLLSASVLPTWLKADTLLVEAESFQEPGGWFLDTAFTHIVGSPYLMAHGLGKPVADAKTTLSVKEAGKYRVWVRTKDWVAHWKAPGKPGRFQVLVQGKPLGIEFGTEGVDWHWQAGGEIEIASGNVELALHDLTGFNGRCDALLLSNDPKFEPPQDKALPHARRQWLGLPEDREDAGNFDIVVVGGGYAGIATAISAARQSLRVAFVQDRFVLGGNGSSEIRVWAQGGTLRGKYPHLGEIVEEFADHAPDSPAEGVHFGDEAKEELVRREKNISLFLGYFVHGIEFEKLDAPTIESLQSSGYQPKKIHAVLGLDVRTGRELRFRAPLFVDCTGHGAVGALAGAGYRIEPQGRMGMSNMWYWQQESAPQAWPATPWALELDVQDFPKTIASKSLIEGKPFMKGEWFWESGFNKDSIQELELIRDWNLRAVFGAFTALKTGAEKEKHANAALKWVAAVGGPRESRLLDGDVILERADIVQGRDFPDGCVPTTWDIDLHYPKEQFAKKYADNPFISRAEFGAGVDRKNGYPVPYRCLYSKDIPNLMMAGRCISVNHEALGTIRVMRTCGMMGEVVGKAAYLCTKYQTTPRGVYQSHLNQLLDLLKQPGAMRRDSLGSELYRDPNIGTVTPYLNKATDKVTGLPANAAPMSDARIQAKSLPGIVVDDGQAKLTGKWADSSGLVPFVNDGYQYAGPKSDSEARFEFQTEAAGKYEVRIAWMPHENRSTQTLCTIERQGQRPLKLRLNQREGTTTTPPFHAIGQFEFPIGTHAIILSTQGSDGNVHADAIQLIKAN